MEEDERSSLLCESTLDEQLAQTRRERHRVRMEKREVKREIVVWIQSFEEREGRKPDKKDKVEVRDLYDRYKQLELEENKLTTLRGELEEAIAKRGEGSVDGEGKDEREGGKGEQEKEAGNKKEEGGQDQDNEEEQEKGNEKEGEEQDRDNEGGNEKEGEGQENEKEEGNEKEGEDQENEKEEGNEKEGEGQENEKEEEDQDRDEEEEQDRDNEEGQENEKEEEDQDRDNEEEQDRDNEEGQENEKEEEDQDRDDEEGQENEKEEEDQDRDDEEEQDRDNEEGQENEKEEEDQDRDEEEKQENDKEEEKQGQGDREEPEEAQKEDRDTPHLITRVTQDLESVDVISRATLIPPVAPAAEGDTKPPLQCEKVEEEWVSFVERVNLENAKISSRSGSHEEPYIPLRVARLEVAKYLDGVYNIRALHTKAVAGIEEQYRGIIADMEVDHRNIVRDLKAKRSHQITEYNEMLKRVSQEADEYRRASEKALESARRKNEALVLENESLLQKASENVKRLRRQRDTVEERMAEAIRECNELHEAEIDRIQEEIDTNLRALKEQHDDALMAEISAKTAAQMRIDELLLEREEQEARLSGNLRAREEELLRELEDTKEEHRKHIEAYEEEQKKASAEREAEWRTRLDSEIEERSKLLDQIRALQTEIDVKGTECKQESEEEVVPDKDDQMREESGDPHSHPHHSEVTEETASLHRELEMLHHQMDGAKEALLAKEQELESLREMVQELSACDTDADDAQSKMIRVMQKKNELLETELAAMARRRAELDLKIVESHLTAKEAAQTLANMKPEDTSALEASNQQIAQLEASQDALQEEIEILRNKAEEVDVLREQLQLVQEQMAAMEAAMGADEEENRNEADTEVEADADTDAKGEADTEENEEIREEEENLQHRLEDLAAKEEALTQKLQRAQGDSAGSRTPQKSGAAGKARRSAGPKPGAKSRPPPITTTEATGDQITLLQNERGSIEQEMAALRQKLAAKEGGAKRAEKAPDPAKGSTDGAALRRAKMELAKATTRANRLETDVNRLKEQIEELRGELADARVSASMAGKTGGGAGGGVDARGVREFEKKVGDRDKKIKSLEQQIEKNKSIAAEKAQSDRSLVESNQKLKELEQKLKRQEAEGNKEGAKKLKTAEDALSRTEKKLATNTKALEQAQEEGRVLQEEVDHLKKDLSKATTELTDLRQVAGEAAELKTRCIELDREVHGLKKEQMRLEQAYRDEQVLRKKYYNIIEDMKGKIRVFARARPMDQREREMNSVSVVSFPDAYTTVVDAPKGKKEFQFDSCFDPSATQAQVFEDTKALCQSAIDGYNVCIFAYGQTGSGKTYTMSGSAEQPGLTPRAFEEIFSIIRRDRDKFAFKLSCYMVELYNDNLVDLLLTKGTPSLKLDIKKDAKGMVIIPNATTHPAGCPEDLQRIFDTGNAARHTAGTKMNATSSRSHLIFSVMLESRNLQTKSVVTGKFSLIDLAGSERVGKTGASADRLKEAQSINKSLTALGDVISSLSAGEGFIPYRNNKLTMLMSDSLGGNAKTLMFVNLSPADDNRDETITSLMYAARVKLITNDAQKNIESKEINRLRKIIADMKAGRNGGDVNPPPDEEEEEEEVPEQEEECV